MELQVPIQIEKPDTQIHHDQHLFLTGSCFSENMGALLGEHKFSILQNPNGILFDPISICNSLISYIDAKQYSPGELFQSGEIWHSWQHHSRFSGPDKQAVLDCINQSQQEAALFIKKADWLVITFGTAFSYRLKNEAGHSMPVANCHKVPAASFHKHLLTIEEMLTVLDTCMHRLFHHNPDLRIIFTVSPVRHIRDGVVENNRSKARLLEVVHHMVNKFNRLYYFPSYELVIDVLRDYRFFEADLVHPNTVATQYVFEQFVTSYMTPATRLLLKEIESIMAAKKHRPFHDQTIAHRQFLQHSYLKAKKLQDQYPYLDLREELNYFSEGSKTL